jgi:hypothetical protein
MNSEATKVLPHVVGSGNDTPGSEENYSEGNFSPARAFGYAVGSRRNISQVSIGEIHAQDEKRFKRDDSSTGNIPVIIYDGESENLPKCGGACNSGALPSFMDSSFTCVPSEDRRSEQPLKGNSVLSTRDGDRKVSNDVCVASETRCVRDAAGEAKRHDQSSSDVYCAQVSTREESFRPTVVSREQSEGVFDQCVQHVSSLLNNSGGVAACDVQAKKRARDECEDDSRRGYSSCRRSAESNRSFRADYRGDSRRGGNRSRSPNARSGRPSRSEHRSEKGMRYSGRRPRDTYRCRTQSHSRSVQRLGYQDSFHRSVNDVGRSRNDSSSRNGRRDRYQSPSRGANDRCGYGYTDRRYDSWCDAVERDGIRNSYGVVEHSKSSLAAPALPPVQPVLATGLTASGGFGVGLAGTSGATRVHSDLPLEWWERADECKDAKAAHTARIDHMCDSREGLVLKTTLWKEDTVLEPNMFPCKCMQPISRSTRVVHACCVG